MLVILRRFQVPFEVVWLTLAFIGLPWLMDLTEGSYWQAVLVAVKHLI